MSESSNRTLVCSVLFLDIAEYSRRSVGEQMRLKQKFNRLLEQALENVAVSDRVVLDTGDGAAISFLGNPEDALYVGLALRSAIGAEPATDPAPLAVRCGVNLGPVRLIKDLNGQLNMIGDGINVAQRVMSFAEAGQLLVSRSYYEVVSRLDPQFEKLFHYEGARTDKHVREHEVYAVGTGAALPPAALASEQTHPREPSASARARFNPRLALWLPLVMGLILAAGLALRAQRSATPEDAIVSPPPKNAPRAAGAAAQAAPKSAEAAAERRRELAEKREARKKEVQRETAEVLRQGQAAALLLIVPWGEVYVDGKPRGVSPPLRVLELAPGKHRVEIRNGDLAPHTEEVQVRAGEKITIRHRFH